MQGSGFGRSQCPYMHEAVFRIPVDALSVRFGNYPHEILLFEDRGLDKLFSEC